MEEEEEEIEDSGINALGTIYIDEQKRIRVSPSVNPGDKQDPIIESMDDLKKLLTKLLLRKGRTDENDEDDDDDFISASNPDFANKIKKALR